MAELVAVTDQEGSPDPVAWGVGHQFQRGAFTAAGRDWVIFAHKGAGTYPSIFVTSNDGGGWETPASIRLLDDWHSTTGICYADFHFDGTYLHYAIGGTDPDGLGTPLVYRRGEPETDGSITWSATEQLVGTMASSVLEVSIETDSSGVPWITYEDYQGDGFPQVWFTKATTADGTFTNAASHPQLVHDLDTHWWTGVARLNNSGDMMLFYWNDEFNTFGSEPNTIYAASRPSGGIGEQFIDDPKRADQIGEGINSAVAYVGDPANSLSHLAYWDFFEGNIMVWSGNGSGGTLQTAIAEVSVSGTDTLALGIDSGTDELVLVYTDNTDLKCIRRDTSGGTWSSPITLVTGTTFRRGSVQITERQSDPFVIYQRAVSGNDEIMMTPTILGDIFDKTGMGVMGISSAITYAKAGGGISARTGAGVKLHNIDRNNTALMPLTGSASDSVTNTEIGQGLAVRTGAGTDASTYSELGSAVNVRTGSGARSIAFTKTGRAETAYTGAGVNGMAKTFIKAGTACMGILPSIPGTAIIGFTASGTRSSSMSKTGAGVTDLLASGTKVFDARDVFDKSGGGAGGAGTPTYGLLSLSFPGGLKAYGAQQVILGNLTYSKSGAAISAYSTTGTRSIMRTRSGSSVSPRVANGADAIRATETATSMIPLTSSGERRSTFIETGLGLSIRVVNGDTVNTYNESGSATTAYIASGTGQMPGITSASGSGVTQLSASGQDQIVGSEANLGVSPREAQGARSVEHHRTGIASTSFTTDATRLVEHVVSGGSVKAWVANGIDETDSGRHGVGQIVMVSNGRRSLVKATSIIGVLAMSASGSKSIASQAPSTVTISRVQGFVGGSKARLRIGRYRVRP